VFSTVYTHTEDIKVTSNKIYVDLITVDDSRIPIKRLNLVLDTGAFMTLISKKKADRYGYKIIEKEVCSISGFSEKGLVCDLRKVPSAVFCNYRIEDVMIATPHNDIPVVEVLGMNILENFNLGFDFADEKIFARKRGGFTSQKPKYQCGEVSIFRENVTGRTE
jgi:predicted aspartyl protease